MSGNGMKNIPTAGIVSYYKHMHVYAKLVLFTLHSSALYFTHNCKHKINSCLHIHCTMTKRFSRK